MTSVTSVDARDVHDQERQLLADIVVTSVAAGLEPLLNKRRRPRASADKQFPGTLCLHNTFSSAAWR